MALQLSVFGTSKKYRQKDKNAMFIVSNNTQTITEVMEAEKEEEISVAS